MPNVTEAKDGSGTVYNAALFPLPDNYIYISHLGGDTGDPDGPPTYWRLPVYPDSISDSMQSTFGSTNALGRSAPVMTYSNSGPRQVPIQLSLHRDMMDDANIDFSNAELSFENNEDYLDSLIKALQAIALPRYNLKNKYVEPPLVGVRFGEELVCVGVVSGTIQVSYKKPILSNNKYACVDLSFTITEVDPYDATEVYKNGSFRNVVQTMRKGFGFEEIED